MKGLSTHRIRLLLGLSLALFLFFSVGKEMIPTSEFIFSPPSSAYWFGTDRLGRDVFARTSIALRVTLRDVGAAAILAAGSAALISFIVLSARKSSLLEFAVDAIFVGLRSVPALLFASVIGVLFKGTTYGTIFALYCFSFVYSVNVFKADMQRSLDSPHLEGATSLGANSYHVFRWYILPDVLPRLARYALLDFASLVAFSSLLGVVGLTPPSEPNLGKLIYDGGPYLFTEYWLFLGPFCVLATVLFILWPTQTDYPN